jgi:chorismate mutase
LNCTCFWKRRRPVAAALSLTAAPLLLLHRRMSLSKFVSNAKSAEEEADRVEAQQTARAERRRSSIMRLGVTDGVRATLLTALNTADLAGNMTGTPEEKLQALLTGAKERGMR